MSKIVFFITGIFAMLIMASTCETTTQSESGTVYLDSAQYAQIDAKIDSSLTLVKNFQSDAWDSINVTLELFSDVISSQGILILQMRDRITELEKIANELQNPTLQDTNYPDTITIGTLEGYKVYFVRQ